MRFASPIWRAMWCVRIRRGLADEAAAISMFGGRRVVRVRDAGDGLSATFESLLAGFAGDALVVVEAGELAKTSSLRKLFEAAKSAAAVECYDDRPEDAGKLIRETLAASGWQIEPLALAYLAEALSTDRRLLRSEVEKLSLYLGAAPKDGVLTLAEAANLIGDSGAVEADEIADAVAAGDVKRLDRLIAKTSEAGASWGTVHQRELAVVSAPARIGRRCGAVLGRDSRPTTNNGCRRSLRAGIGQGLCGRCGFCRRPRRRRARPGCRRRRLRNGLCSR